MNTCKRLYATVLIETYIVTHVYKKIKTSFPHHTVDLQVLSTKTVSDCSLTYFKLFQKLSCSGRTWLNKMKSTKITFECFFIAQNPIQSILGFRKILEIFFSKNLNFCMFRPPPPSCICKKSKVNKKSLLSSLS